MTGETGDASSHIYMRHQPGICGLVAFLKGGGGVTTFIRFCATGTEFDANFHWTCRLEKTRDQLTADRTMTDLESDRGIEVCFSSCRELLLLLYLLSLLSDTSSNPSKDSVSLDSNYPILSQAIVCGETVPVELNWQSSRPSI